MPETAEFVTGHQQITGRTEHRMHLADITGHHHRIDVRPRDQDAVDYVGARQAQGDLAALRNDDAWRHEGKLCRDDTRRHLAVLLDPGAEIGFGELSGQMEGRGIDPLEVRGRVPMQGQRREQREPEDDEDEQADRDCPTQLGALDLVLGRRHRLTQPCREEDRPAGRSTPRRSAEAELQLRPTRLRPTAPRAAPAVAAHRDQPVAPQRPSCRSLADLHPIIRDRGTSYWRCVTLFNRYDRIPQPIDRCVLAREQYSSALACRLHCAGFRSSPGGPQMEINAAVFRKVHEKLAIETVEIDKPWGREVLVRTAATGVCHSDLHVVDGQGRFPLDRPIVLGHEGAGVVEAVGAEVTAVKPGDHIVACLSGFCGNCPQCLSGHPNLCTGGIVTRPETAAPRLSQNGQPLRQFIGISSYAEKMLLHENSLVKIDPDLPLDQAALVGCGVLTGVGAALRSSGMEAGQTVAVFGCGGVGLSIVQGARIGGARQIIAIDQFGTKRQMAMRVGATHFVNSAEDDPVRAVRALTGGSGVDHAFEAVGNAKLVRQAIESLAIRGTATIVGVLPPDAMIEFPWMAIRPECKVQTSRMGSNRFRYDIPLYLDFYRQGRLDLDSMVTKRGRLGDINEAFRAMKAGEVARTVLTFD